MTAAAGHPDRRRAPLLRAAAVTWLALISVIVLVDRIALSNLSDDDDASPAVSLATLEQRVQDLADQVEAARRQPAALPQARDESDARALTKRLAAVEHALANRDASEDQHIAEHQSIADRLDQLEARVDEWRQASTAAPRPRAPAPPQRPAEPAFRIVGIERRADQAFVSILPLDATSPAQARLLLPGDAEAGWRLDAIESDAAVFRHGDVQRRLALPAR